MKRQILFFLLAVIFPLVANADVWQDPETKVNYEFTPGKAEAQVEYSQDVSGEITILSDITINGSKYKVTSIGSYAFYVCQSLTSVKIPSSVTSIGDSTFYVCDNLTTISLPYTLTSIGYNAFVYCRRLAEVHITDLAAWSKIEFKTGAANPLSNGAHLFLNDEEITDLLLPKDLTAIGPYAFWGCSSLKSITIPEGVTTIGKSAFNECSGLTSISIPSSVTSIGEGAFWDCSSLTSVIIEGTPNISLYDFFSTQWYENQPDGVVYTDNFVLGYKGTMPASTEISLKDGTTSIASYAFYGCSGLTAITIPEGVTTIGSAAFYECSGLTAINIPSSVTTIGEYNQEIKGKTNVEIIPVSA